MILLEFLRELLMVLVFSCCRGGYRRAAQDTTMGFGAYCSNTADDDITHPTGDFSFTINGGIGVCFEQTVFTSSAHALLLLVSLMIAAFYTEPTPTKIKAASMVWIRI